VLPQVLTWNSHHADASIAGTLALVREAQEGLALASAIERRAQQLASQWSLHLLFERKEGGQALGFGELQRAFQASFGARSDAIREGGLEIATILADSLRRLSIGKASGAWLAFVDHIAAMVIQGLKDTAHASLRHLAALVRFSRGDCAAWRTHGRLSCWAPACPRLMWRPARRCWR
jgi:hypothetical protein